MQDCATSTKRALTLGAQLACPVTPLPSFGVYSVLIDPFDVPFALFSGHTDLPQHPTRPGHLSLADYACARAGDFGFYPSLVGWRAHSHVDLGQDGRHGVWGLAYGDIGTVGVLPGVAPGWVFHVHVDDLRGSLAVVEAFGGEVVSRPRGGFAGHLVATCRDPDGVRFALQTRQ